MPPEPTTGEHATRLLADQRKLVIGLVTLLLGSALLSGFSAVQNAVVWRSEYDVHLMADSVWKREQRELSLEVLCEVKPSSRKCR